MKFQYTNDQLAALEGLAYRIADSAYMQERFDLAEIKIEFEQNHSAGKAATKKRTILPAYVL